MTKQKAISEGLTFEEFKAEVLKDYRLANESRQASLLGRKEVLTGKAKFGIFGDGKEIAQIALAKAFKNGDFRSGYYRDQTFMFAIGELTIQQFFAQLYAHTDVEQEPSSAGRLMNGHYGTRLINPDGTWKKQTEHKNSSSDISPTAGQMPRLLGLAWASKLYRNNPELHRYTEFSINGNEVAFGTIGDASTSEGPFWETINAAGVLQVPMAVSVWDDGYGISVPNKYQTTKQSISDALRGFERNEKGEGYLIYTVKGWDYAALCQAYQEGVSMCRKDHVPVLFHIQEVTQPQGHSTSGSHERYKTKERLEWETEFDGIKKMRDWIIENAIANSEELDIIESEAKKTVNDAKKAAWDAFNKDIKKDMSEAMPLLEALAAQSNNDNGIFVKKAIDELKVTIDPTLRDVAATVRKVFRYTRGETNESRSNLLVWYSNFKALNYDRYNSELVSEGHDSALKVLPVAIEYREDAQMVDGREILNFNFDALFARESRLVAFGEDLGKIGDVNQGFAGLQEKYGEIRISDTGIRECTITGQGIGAALRGLRPIAEIQYLDYLLYAIQILSDDVATLRYRTKGGQRCPLIIRTRGHRLEGVWHSGSPMGMILHAVRGIHVLVPRDMTRAAGFYNTLLVADEPAIVVEPLNGYRLKEKLPNNMGEFRLPLGMPEIISEGTDITLVTYGSCVKIAQDAAKQLAETGISVEVIDVQTLLPFDINHRIVESLKKTNKVLFFDEDVPGGASAYMMQEVLECQNGYQYLDAAPRTLTAKAHRPAYSSDGDYFSKPNVEDVVETVYELLSEYNPQQYPKIY